MLPFRLVYSDGYDLNLGQHVFQAEKYRLVHDRLLKDRFADAADFVVPEPAADEDVRLAHDAVWVEKLRHGTLSFHEILKLEIPYSRKMVEATWLMTGGTILAARHALETGFGFNIGGGFHHAFAGHGEGFCPINDVAVAARKMQKDGLARQVMVVDTDVHQGNGTAGIFGGDDSVFTLSIHQMNNYPYEKPPSDLDINLEDGVSDAEYLQKLEEGLMSSLEQFEADLIFHVSGADPFMEDQLGGLLLTTEGLCRRDHMIYEIARNKGIPVAVVLAGGYAFNPHDTVTIHTNSVKTGVNVFRGAAMQKN